MFEERSGKAPTSRDALSLLLAGETEAGLDLYDLCLKRTNRHNIPFGLHLIFLEQAGLAEVAKDLRHLALRRGGNIALKDVKPGVSPAEVAEEYEALFARGMANSRMIFRYMMALSRLGRTDEVAALLDPSRLLRRIQLDRPGPNGEAGGLAEAVQAMLIREEGRAEDRDFIQPFSKVPVLQRFHNLEDPAARALTAALREEADHYVRDWAASDHPLAPLVSREVRLDVWALFARNEGYCPRHLHPQGWSTGVYYPVGVEGDGPEGHLHIGPPEELEAVAPNWPRAVIRPEPGLLVLMPSYCMHWTVPSGGPGLRTSIAFDMLDVPKPQAGDARS
ncbi:MAG TPA: putative 2OG-Fe(II) oxygenase [Allosphingosinicella sp.]|nr:putative 2OG-Fe(II) oxygenase [Allosphingosinicella sp.]